MRRVLVALFMVFGMVLPAAAQDVDPDVLRAQASNGDVSAAVELGKYYRNEKKDARAAEKWIFAAAQAGNAEAQYLLAKIYDDSREGKHPNREVVAWLEKSAMQGYTDAQLMLGKIYQFGRRGIAKDLNKAKIWYDMAAAKGSQTALTQLEAIYVYSKDGYSKAVQINENVAWLDTAVRQGNAEAALRLAAMAERGKGGVPQDYKRAADLYRMAADAGIPQGEAGLGALYAEGNGVPQDYEKAVFWLNKAAEQGYVEAQRKLADIYAYKRGDPAKAYAWMVISLSAMFPNTPDLVQVSPDLERLLRSMTPKQVKEGQTLAMQLVTRIRENKKIQEENQKEQLEQMKKYQEGFI